MRQLHVFFLPLMAHGHMIPAMDMAKLFSSRGLKATIISTPAFSEPVKKAQHSGFKIELITIGFPHRDSGLPDHIVSLDQVTSDPKLLPMFFKALSLIQQPVEDLIQRLNPDCLVSDMFLPWTADSAATFGIPRLVFHGTSYFSLCVSEEMRRHKPFNDVVSDSEPFLIPNLPHQVKLLKTQVSDYNLHENKDDFSRWIQQMRESDARSYGVVINSFHDLEPDYARHYTHVLERKAWSLGPLSLCTNEIDGAKHQCLAWLDSKKKPNSVVYVCFGSMAKFTPAQLNELANGLDASGQDFIWIVRSGGDEEWLPERFEERMEGRGLVVRGWAPQRAILDHPAVGAFVTHCGWNSTLEGVCAGLPMVTWPLFAEQFFNEKLVTEVLRIGVPVGNKKWQRGANEGVSREAVARAVRGVMVGGGAAEMRRRAADSKEKARKAVAEGGSSYEDLTALIQDIATYVPPKKMVCSFKSD
ncbi:scopoletin glucosyltransferase-like [Salvia miltiorrhiza]|uniref:scopoletin glucosyltransferase-like n=1 Tax=Salvia miltiorrhiza TaxID=226208 RepID=UPI0025ACCACA|nr:scopoletin glucosyltransferase-like [Salvia miltiorrhiza]